MRCVVGQVVALSGARRYQRSVLPSYVELASDYWRRHVAFMTALLGPWVEMAAVWMRPLAETARELGGHAMMSLNFTLPWKSK